jgi:hypothetical protein
MFTGAALIGLREETMVDEKVKKSQSAPEQAPAGPRRG